MFIAAAATIFNSSQCGSGALAFLFYQCGALVSFVFLSQHGNG
jgi:hypothetical protein